MADINKLRQEIAIVEKELKSLEKNINNLNGQIIAESSKYNNNKKNDQELTKRIRLIEQSLKIEKAKYDTVFERFFSLTEELEAAEKEFRNSQNNQKTR
jgi:septal ring factor EnvC (AmiA/AmiB activator)